MSSLPNPGDLVCHYIYDRSEWLALVLAHNMIFDDNSQLFVKMIPGIKLEKYFDNHSTSGWVYSKWLWVLKENVNDVKKDETDLY